MVPAPKMHQDTKQPLQSGTESVHCSHCTHDEHHRAGSVGLAAMLSRSHAAPQSYIALHKQTHECTLGAACKTSKPSDKHQPHKHSPAAPEQPQGTHWVHLSCKMLQQGNTIISSSMTYKHTRTHTDNPTTLTKRAPRCFARCTSQLACRHSLQGHVLHTWGNRQAQGAANTTLKWQDESPVEAAC
jgi:hypothetical protein